MSRTKFYPFWKAPLTLWTARISSGTLGVVLLVLFGVSVWDAITNNAFTIYKLWPSGTPFYYTFYFSSSPHWVYWGALVGYSTTCFVIGSFFSVIAYTATFRAVIPEYWKKKTS